MEFRIADTFTDSLSRLTGNEQKAVKTTAFDLQMNPAAPGLQLHKLDRVRDPNFLAVRVNRDVRLIVHRSSASLLLCYVGHHDDAYQWAERRKLEVHPQTGAAQLVEIRETVQEITVPKFVVREQPVRSKTYLFARHSDADLLKYGVPPEWLDDVRQADEDSVLDLCDHLPGEAAEALLELATGGSPQPAQLPPLGGGSFDHPDALRRFRVMSNVEELERALDYPSEKWSVFLHPVQQELVEKDYGGPARVSGSAGTGKTVVALHRAAYLARTHSEARVLLATFSDTLANSLRTKLKRLISHEPRLAERLEVHSMGAIGKRLYTLNIGRPEIATRQTLLQILQSSAAKVEAHRFSARFLMNEWEQVVDAWQLETWEDYRDVLRLGRRTRLPESRRVVLWTVFEGVRSELRERGLLTVSEMFSRLAEKIAAGKHLPFDYTVIDEAQDITVAQLKFLAALGARRANCLFFAGDLGQRIFQQPFSWKALGVEIRGRSHTLRVNYRTSHQIRMQADRLLGSEMSDVDGNTESRSGTISIFNGPNPEIAVLDSPEEEAQVVGQWLSKRSEEGLVANEIGVFVRSESEMERARAAVRHAGLHFKVLDEKVEATAGHVSISTMHLAKGLEFKAVAVMACDDEVLPLQERIETVADDSDLEEVYNTERNLLYVACTRARDHLLVTGVQPESEFLDDLRT